jgi:putative N-acetylmannosamine-6-phosphate epimerase
MSKEMPKHTPEDVEELKEQFKKERGRKMVSKMTTKEIALRREEIETDLKEKVDPVIAEKIKRESVDARTEMKNEEELPILGAIEKKELSPEQKRVKLEKLKEYLEDLENGEVHPIVINIETEKDEVIEKIEKLEKELEEEKN